MKDPKARQAIREALYRLCRGADRKDEALVRSVYMPGGTLALEGSFSGTVDEFVEWTRNPALGNGRRQHNLTNINVAIDGDRASSEAYIMTLLAIDLPAGPALFQSHGRYLDAWVLDDHRWRIAHRRYVREFQIVHPLPGPEAADFSSGARDNSDPSYAMDPQIGE